MKKAVNKKPLTKRIRNLLLTVLLPMTALIVVELVLFASFNAKYTEAVGNITRASGFSQTFKNDIDLKMYYLATESEYASGAPTDEIETALQLAHSLLENTKNKDSVKAITSVIDLCEELRDRVKQICNTSEYDERINQLESNVYILTDLISQYMSTYLYNEAAELAVLQERMGDLLRTEVTVTVIAAFLIVLVTINQSVRVSRSITNPIDELYKRAKDIGEGDLEPRKPVEAGDIKLQTLSDGLEEMVKRLNRQMDVNREEAERLRGLELMLIQAQINPHFLYSTLDTIIWLMDTDNKTQAARMVANLSNFFRSSLSRGNDVITLSEEELHVKSYLDIQQVRYKNLFSYTLEIDPIIDNTSIPRLTLQPLVENALYHGIKKNGGKGSISIVGRLLDSTGDEPMTTAVDEIEDRMVSITVSDTGAGMNEESLQKVVEELENEHITGYGMAAVYKRIKLLFGDAGSFSINSKEGEGTQISIVFPYRKTEEISDVIKGKAML